MRSARPFRLKLTYRSDLRRTFIIFFIFVAPVPARLRHIVSKANELFQNEEARSDRSHDFAQDFRHREPHIPAQSGCAAIQTANGER
jgi:hypothetical protein